MKKPVNVAKFLKTPNKEHFQCLGITGKGMSDFYEGMASPTKYRFEHKKHKKRSPTYWQDLLNLRQKNE